MRTLIYVPIIHTSADLGSLAKALTNRGMKDLGEEMWKRHEEAVLGFWRVIEKYFDNLNVSCVKIYQDGMVADGEVGEKIVEEGMKMGSKNYELVSSLLKKGALLVKTEDFQLVKEERDKLLAMMQAQSLLQKVIACLKYKLSKNQLLAKRDTFIAQRISETLHEGEKGILFLGAYHNIKDKLPKDIQLIEIKDTEKIRDYQRLLPFYHQHKERFEELSEYLVSEIDSSACLSEERYGGEKRG